MSYRNKCGAGIPDQRIICANCEPVRTPAVAAVRRHSHFNVESGVDGWLLILVISLVIAAPSVFVYSLHLRTSGFFHVEPSGQRGIRTYDTVLLAFRMLNVTAGLYAGVQLWRREKGALQFAKAYFVLRLVAILILPVVADAIGVFPEARAALEPTFVRYASSIVINSAVWGLYLTFSRRVRATYLDR